MTIRSRERADPFVLLVEDDEADVIFVRRCFTSLGKEKLLVVARDGKEALEILTSDTVFSHPYVIITDLNMPGMSGHDFIERIRCTSRLRNSVIFVMSSSRLDNDIERSYTSHVAGYITKDGSTEELARDLRTLVGYCQTLHLPNCNPR